MKTSDTNSNAIKTRIHNILTVSKKSGNLSWYFDLFIITLIILNVIAIVLESIEPLRQQFPIQFVYFEIFSVIVFTAEYILRVWTANLISEFKKPIIGNIKYALTPLAIIDFLAFIPFYLPFFGVDLRLLRMLRIFRIFRLFKIARYVEALSFINHVFKKKREELVISLIFTVFLLLIASTLMYYIENETQPENFSSIPETMWWGIATLTTVGYGDITAVSIIEKIVAVFLMITGVIAFSFATGTLASIIQNQDSNEAKLKEKMAILSEI